MSIILGIIMSKDYELDLLEKLKEEYDLGLFKLKNFYVDAQLMPDEVFLQATKTGCDSLTGIGAYDLYNKDLSEVYKVIKDKRLLQSFIDEIGERKQGYKKDVLRWIEVITLLKNVYKVGKFGVLLHMCTEGFPNEKVTISKRIVCNLSNISVEYMMKIEEDVIVFFE